jgi:uncharacterized protein YkvS
MMKFLLALVCVCSLNLKAFAFEDEDAIGPGSRITYTPDGSTGVVTSINYNSACVRFDYARPDGAINRCGISINLLRENYVDGSMRPGTRVVYTPDGSTGVITSVNYNSACVRFDYPRPDGAWERCGVSLSYLARGGGNYNPPNGDVFTRGSRIIYTVDNSTGVITSLGNGAACVQFDYPRPDGAYNRCGISIRLLRLY